MANDGQIVFEVTADGKHAIADIKEITRAIQQETGKWDDAAKESTDNMGNGFTNMLKKVAAGFSAVKIGKALLDIGSAAVSAASDLQEVQNVVDTTFGANANQIDTWAKNAISQFGLTETQAKKFSSTMGAMLKSSGLAGDEIVQVSTDLAGLAADMSSFYNLDFDEAFSKIRSGIAGMSMPLKELGIDMSVDTLNAFALSQGLKKTFSQMTQSEQVMLRYQYLMKATADAQGDFAKTSDGYANGLRLLNSNFTSIKTNLGNYVLPYVNDVLTAINKLFPEEKRNDSILHQLSDLQLKKDEKIAEITAIREVADELILTLEQITTNTNAQDALASLASGANSLNASSVGNWKSILSSLQGIDGLENIFNDSSSATGTVEGLAEALAGNSVTTSKAQAWNIFLSALGNNADAVSKLTGGSAEETAKWLKDMATAASDLEPGDAESWDKLMSAFVGGISLNTDQGKQFVETLAQNFLALGNGSEDAVKGLASLGFSTEDIEQKQESWLRVCKELVSTIPGLSSIIDTNTGEVKGGIPALKAYADEWERTAKYQAEIEALRSAKDIYNANNNQASLNADVTAKRAVSYAKLSTSGMFDGLAEETKREFLDEMGVFVKDLVNEGAVSWDEVVSAYFGDDVSKLPQMMQWVGSVKGEAREALLSYAEAVFKATLIEKERPLVLEEIEREEARVAEEYNKTKEAVDAEASAAKEAAKEMTVLEKAASGDEDAMKQVTDAVNGANEALKSLADHVEGVRNSIASSLDSATKGFEYLGNAAERQAKRLEPVNKEIDNLDKKSKTYEKDLEKLLGKKANAQDTYGLSNLNKNLKSQLSFLTEYKKDMEKAQQMGFSKEFLAQFADGSVESAEWLHEIVKASGNATEGQVKNLNDLFADVTKTKEELTGVLTDQQLSVDSVYQTLAQKAQEAVAKLNLGEQAAENSAQTIQGVADGINGKSDEVKSAVDGILSQLNRLDGWGFSLDLGGFGNITFTTSTGKNADSSGRFGIDYVPRDDYLIRAHEGERLLTAQENQIWNTLLNGGIAGYDLETLGGVMRDIIKPGGNVYLDGKIVGDVISSRQGRIYKSMQRSGWQG